MERTEKTESLKEDREILVKDVGEKSRENVSGVGWGMVNGKYYKEVSLVKNQTELGHLGGSLS